MVLSYFVSQAIETSFFALGSPRDTALQGYNFPDHPYLVAFVTYPLVGIALSLIIAYLEYLLNPIFIGVILHTKQQSFWEYVIIHYKNLR